MLVKLMLSAMLILGLILIAVLVMRQSFVAHLNKLEAEIKNSSDPSLPRTDLPPVVMAYLSRLGVSNLSISKFVTFEQTGQMWQASGGKPMDFTARQIISTNEPEFIWRAQASFADSVLVADYFVKSTGGMEVKLLGTVSLVNMVGGESVAKGETLRFLAELPLNPDAILFNTALEWTAIDSKSFKVALGRAPATVPRARCAASQA